MNIKIRFLMVAGLFLLLTGATFAALGRSTPAGNPYTTVRITDSTAAPGSAGFSPRVGGIVTANSAHVTWGEELADGTFGGFHRQLPFGVTTQISGFSAPVNTFDPLYFLAPDNSLTLLFRQYGAEGSDLYLWQPRRGDSIRLSDPALSEGDAFLTNQVLFDSNSAAHIFWVEESTGMWEENLYYWNDVSETTVIASDPALDAGNIGHYTAAVDGDDEVHVAYRDFDTDAGLGALFYWDTGTGVRRQLSTPGVNASDGLEMIVDGAGTPHTFWLESGCPYHWSPGMANAEALTSDPNACSGSVSDTIYAAADGSGVVHFFWISPDPNSGGGALYIWRSNSGTVDVHNSVLPSGSQSIEPVLAGDGTMYLVWADDSNPSEDLKYWNSADEMVRNVSSAATSNVGTPEMFVDSGNDLHLVWSEGGSMFPMTTPDLYYYGPGVTMTLQLTDPAVVEGPPGSLSATLDDADVVHVAWTDFAVSDGQQNAYYWNSSDRLLTEVITATVDLANLRFSWAFDGSLYATWEESVTGEGTDRFIWSQANGAVDVSDVAQTSGDVAAVGTDFVAVDDNGNPYAAWFEESGTASEEDAFAAYIRPELPFRLNLPVITQ